MRVDAVVDSDLKNTQVIPEITFLLCVPQVPCPKAIMPDAAPRRQAVGWRNKKKDFCNTPHHILDRPPDLGCLFAIGSCSDNPLMYLSLSPCHLHVTSYFSWTNGLLITLCIHFFGRMEAVKGISDLAILRLLYWVAYFWVKSIEYGHMTLSSSTSYSGSLKSLKSLQKCNDPLSLSRLHVHLATMHEWLENRYRISRRSQS